MTEATEQAPTNGRALLTSEHAQVLASGAKSKPYWAGRTPRWILRFLLHHEGYVAVDGGSLRINQVTEPYLDVRTSVKGAEDMLPRENLQFQHSHAEGTPLQASYALYDVNPKQVFLKPIQKVVKIHMRAPTLFSTHHDQLREQIDLAAEYIYEEEENLFFSHPDYGILDNIHPRYQMTVKGPPTPDVLDELLSRVWKEPDMFLMHPEALQTFRAEANARSLTLENVERCGGVPFTSWRGIPIFPSNKLFLREKPGKEKAAGNGQFEAMDRVPGESTTQVLLMRIGERKQGVVGLYAAKNPGSEQYPLISVDLMNISDDSVASYLLTTYVAAAILTPDAVARADVTI
jgi:hypothetical protein